MTELPTTFGKYFLTEKLATGGMAEIYLAKLVGPGGFEKQLVIKQIHPRLTGQRHFVDLFVAEAKTLVTLAHGNIVPVYELGVIDDTYFIAMEYIDGPTLYRLTEALSRRGASMDPAVAAWIAAKILEGLDYAHRKGEGVIHRDLSPRNVMLSRDGEVKLVDFGIAVTLGAVDAGSDTQSAPTGSFPYMSPEQVRREPLTFQTDLFTLGVLLWEMLVGQRLFARNDADETLAAVTDGPIARPSERRKDVPAKLDEVVMRALERDQSTRWASAGEMLAALQRYLYGLEATPGPREIGTLVARFCPPETRRLPTHADAPIADDSAPVQGPHTAVIDRDAVARGKGRARTESFATNVDLEGILSAATPMLGITRLPEAPQESTQVAPPRKTGASANATAADDDGSDEDDAARDPTPVPPPEPLGGTDDDEPRDSSSSSGRRAASSDESPRRRAASNRGPDAEADNGSRRPATSGRITSVRPDSEPIIERPDRGPLGVPGRSAPARASLVLVAIGSTILAVGAIYIFMRGRGAVLRVDAGPKYDAPYYAFGPEGAVEIDALLDVRDSPDPDPAIDATGVQDAKKATVDAVVVQRDAVTKLDAAGDGPVVAGFGKLSVGANPWADVLIDGLARGRAPKLFDDVPAGKHVVDLIFSGEDPPIKKTFTITIKAGETAVIPTVDFTK